jgi:hypothetical protein
VTARQAHLPGPGIALPLGAVDEEGLQARQLRGEGARKEGCGGARGGHLHPPPAGGALPLPGGRPSRGDVGAPGGRPSGRDPSGAVAGRPASDGPEHQDHRRPPVRLAGGDPAGVVRLQDAAQAADGGSGVHSGLGCASPGVLGVLPHLGPVYSHGRRWFSASSRSAP